MTPQRSLFRQEAVDFQQHHRQWGNVASLQPLSTKVVAWFITGVVAGICVFLFLAEYSRKETAIGYLTPTLGTAKIFTPQRGTIREVHVDQGGIVREGDPLLTVETNQISADGADVNASMLETLVSQKELLAKNITAEERRAVSELGRLTALVRGLESEISQLRGQAQLQSETLKVLESDLSSADQLRAKGYMPAVEFKKRQVQVLEQRQGLGALNQQLVAKQNQLTEARYSLQQLPTVMAQKVLALRNDLATTDQRIAEVKGRRAYVVRAPTAGRVTTLQAMVGHSADPERLQLEIIPENAVLQAELFIPARAVGFVEVGQPVRILYEAFPYQHFGTHSGQVLRISRSLLTSSDASGPIALKEPAYRVTATLDQAEIDASGKKVPLQPDMLLKADIILEKRSLISWLTSPLRSIRT